MAYGFFAGLVDSGRVRSRAELRSLYRRLVKKYHPDTSRESRGAIDFDELKREYLEAASRLETAGFDTGFPSGRTEGAAARPFAYEPAAFVGELRDLVARGLPVSAKAVRKNREYAKSIDYVSKCMDRLYGGAYGFPEMNDQMKFLYARMPRAYWYVLQTLWCCFDCASGYSEAATIADRHRGCISGTLEGFGFGKLDAFLGDLIGIVGRLKAKLRLE